MRRETILVLMILVLPTIVLYSLHRLSEGSIAEFLVPSAYKSLGLSERSAIREIRSRRFVFIGGPHRSGTTLLRDLVQTSPEVNSFDARRAAVSDYAEGMYLQSVYPSVGVGRERTRFNHQRKNDRIVSGGGGMGTFAFNPAFHLTETSSLASKASAVQLFNQWGWYWTIAKPNEGPRVHLEKSPSNMIMSRFLQALFGKDRTSFVFITRHPIANALAQMRTRNLAPNVRFEDLVAHWIQQHELLGEDWNMLSSAMLVRFELLTSEPRKTLSDVWRHLRVAPPATWPENVAIELDPNRKYREMYCMNDYYQQQHDRIVRQFGAQVRKFGYVLDDWCAQGW